MTATETAAARRRPGKQSATKPQRPPIDEAHGWRKFPEGFPEDGTTVEATHVDDAMGHPPARASFTPQRGFAMSHFFIAADMRILRLPTHWRPITVESPVKSPVAEPPTGREA